MMNLSFEEVDGLSLYEYEELLWHWNEAHSTDDSTPDPQVVMPMIDMINADSRFTN